MIPAWRRAFVSLVVLTIPLTAFAADEPGKTELGFLPFSVAVTSANGENLTVVGAPAGGGFLGTGERGLYVQQFVTTKLALEPQLSATGFFSDGGNFRAVSLTFSTNYLFRGTEQPSPYAFGGGGLWHA